MIIKGKIFRAHIHTATLPTVSRWTKNKILEWPKAKHLTYWNTTKKINK